MTTTESKSLAQDIESYAAELAPAVNDVVRRAASTIPAFAARLESAGLRADDVSSQGLQALPIVTKDDVLALQRQAPPFGGMLSAQADLRRVFQSPGPIYEPQLGGSDPWRWAPALRATGLGAGETVLNCFGYHLSPAGAMFEEGVLAVGASVLPGGIGNQDLQVQAIADVGVTAYVGLPSYLKTLIERYDAAGLPAERWQLTKALVTAEPLPDSLRALLQERVPTVLMAYGTAEVGLIAFETEPGGGLLPAPGVHVDVCDLSTGEPITEGEGQVVVTLLRDEYPLVRFGTGDLSAWIAGTDGVPRLAGVLGRVGEAVKVRGMFLHPRQAGAVMDGLEGVEQWRFVIERRDHRDELRCQIVPLAAPEATTDHKALTDRVSAAVRAGLRFGVQVEVVDALPADGGPILDHRDWD
ncbi:MAG: AMP-binding protein [Dermatophilaceae bacterium]